MKFQEMTAPELKQVPRDHSVIVAPIAACEQHSRHLATFTDSILVTAVGEDVEKRLPDQVLLLPTLWLGASAHHLPLGGTLSVTATLHVAILEELLTPLLEEGYRRILILNGHGGNIDTMRLGLRALQPRYRDRILAGASYWELAEKELAALADGPRQTMGHACEFETSMMMALRPDLVRRQEIKDDPRLDNPTLRGLYVAEDMKQGTDHGAVGYPERATAEKGRAFLNAAGERTAEVIRALLQKRLPDPF